MNVWHHTNPSAIVCPSIFVHKTGKVVPYAINERWDRSWSRFLGSQPAGHFVINLVVGCHYFHQACSYLPSQTASLWKELHIRTAPPKVKQKCVLIVINKIHVVYLCIYVTRARYSWISLISWQSLSCFKTNVNCKEFISVADSQCTNENNTSLAICTSCIHCIIHTVLSGELRHYEALSKHRSDKNHR